MIILHVFAYHYFYRKCYCTKEFYFTVYTCPFFLPFLLMKKKKLFHWGIYNLHDKPPFGMYFRLISKPKVRSRKQIRLGKASPTLVTYSPLRIFPFPVTRLKRKTKARCLVDEKRKENIFHLLGGKNSYFQFIRFSLYTVWLPRKQ